MKSEKCRALIRNDGVFLILEISDSLHIFDYDSKQHIYEGVIGNEKI